MIDPDLLRPVLRVHLDGLFAAHGAPDPGPETDDDRERTVDLVEPKTSSSVPK